MSELPPDEPSIAATRADPARRKATAQEARGAQSFAVTSSPAAKLIRVGAAEASFARLAPPPVGTAHCKSEAGDRMKRACPHPSTTETLSNWERFASGPSESTPRTRRAGPPCQVNGAISATPWLDAGWQALILRYLPQYMDAKVEAGEAWHVQGGFY
jgi:hypothetical protein